MTHYVPLLEFTLCCHGEPAYFSFVLEFSFDSLLRHEWEPRIKIGVRFQMRVKASSGIRGQNVTDIDTLSVAIHYLVWIARCLAFVCMSPNRHRWQFLRELGRKSS